MFFFLNFFLSLLDRHRFVLIEVPSPLPYGRCLHPPFKTKRTENIHLPSNIVHKTHFYYMSSRLFHFQSCLWRKLPGPKPPAPVRGPRGVRSADKPVAPRGRRGHSAHVLGDCMLVYGGYRDMQGSTNELWAFYFGESLSLVIPLVLLSYFHGINLYYVLKYKPQEQRVFLRRLLLSLKDNNF